MLSANSSRSRAKKLISHDLLTDKVQNPPRFMQSLFAKNGALTSKPAVALRMATKDTNAVTLRDRFNRRWLENHGRPNDTEMDGFFRGQSRSCAQRPATTELIVRANLEAVLLFFAFFAISAVEHS